MSSFSKTITLPLRVAKRAVPRPIRSKLSQAFDSLSSSIAGLPPAQLRSWISPTWFSFHDTGRDQLEFLVEMAGLRPNHSVLDIACGIGRLAIPLTTYLDKSGSYHGFDIMEELIKWCQTNISSRHSNFSFETADIATRWSPKGQVPADKYIFPFSDMRFDLAYAGSIFTHILPDGAQNYLSETARVLKPGGKLVSTWLAYNKRTVQLTSTTSVIKRNWRFDHGDFRVKDEDQPEASVAYEEGAIRRMYADAGLDILEPFRPDASYNSARIPDNRSEGIHLHHALCIIAVRPGHER
jgi:SAM-dependent methyltransferase